MQRTLSGRRTLWIEVRQKSATCLIEKREEKKLLVESNICQTMGVLFNIVKIIHPIILLVSGRL